MKNITVTCVLVLLPTCISAQVFAIPDGIERLAAKAKATTNVTLDGALLQQASQFLTRKDGDESIAKGLISKLRSIHVRSFEFENEGEYSDQDLDSIRRQIDSQWSQVVESRDNREHTQVFMKQQNGQMEGLVVLSAEARELTIVIIDGSIDLAALSKLAGSFGIPRDLPNLGGGTMPPGR